MGCDIHAFLEKKTKDKWITIQRIEAHSYNLFGILAGVRTPIKPIVPLRGIPDDADTVKREADIYGFDAHSRTWYTVEELFNFKGPVIPDNEHFSLNYGYQIGYAEYYTNDILEAVSLFNNKIKILIKDDDIKLYRVVMYFDN